MKAISKFLSAAALVALASCSSDDLNFGNSGQFDQKKLVGNLEVGTTRTGIIDSKEASYPIVWSAGDKLNVYSLEQNLMFDEYTLTSGAGSATGEFSTETTNVNINEDHPVAVTSSNLVYGVSATTDGKAKLTTEIPATFNWDEQDAVDVEGAKYYTNDAPYWGNVTTSASSLTVDFKKLTGAIKIDAALLPEGTKAVVIASAKANQPLSGTFSTILEGDNVLAANAQLVNSNCIRVDFPKLPAQSGGISNQRVFILPLVCGQYDNLKFLAIVRDKGETGFTTATPANIIPNDGTDEAKKIDRGTEGSDYYLLRSTDNVKVTTETVLSIYPAVAQTLNNMTPMQISEEVLKLYDGKHDFIFNITNIKMDNSYASLTNDNTIYIPRNLASEGSYRKASITFNFDNTLNQAANTTLNFVEANYIDKPWIVTNNGLHFQTASSPAATAPTTENSNSGTYARKINVNLQNGSSTKVPVNVYLPTSRVSMGIAGGASYEEVVTVIGENSNAINNVNGTAGVNIVGDYKNVEVLAAHKGGSIVKGDVTVDALKISNPTAGLLKIDDASVAAITYVDQTTNQFIYTVGSAAIKGITDASDKIRVRAFWTGKPLTTDQINASYDNGTIYTAAQLASMGKNTSSIYTYTISSWVSQMQLGGDTYKWDGPVINASTNDFSLDGNGVGLRSMNLTKEGLTNTTTDLGLIKSIAAANVTIKNIDLYQAVLNTSKKVDNVGALVGKIVATGNVSLGGSLISVREIDLATAGSNVGGLFGYVKNSTKFNLQSTALTLSVTKISADGNNVGGVAGLIDNTNTNIVAQSNSTINISATGNISAGGSNVGGFYGKANSANGLIFSSKITANYKDITAGGANAGGLVGIYNAGSGDAKIGNYTAANTVSLKATKIAADLNAVGGLIGNADKGALTIGGKAAVTATVGELAGAYNVGGLVGLNNVAASIKGYDKYTVTATIGKFTNTKDADFFNTTELKLACGSFGGMIGWANAKVTIDNPKYNIVTNANSLLSNANKAALNFKVNVAEEKDAYGNAQYFWGDNNYNVGYVVEGYDYEIYGSKQTVNSDYNQFKAY